MEIAIGFFRVNWWVMRWIDFFSRSGGIDHCSLIYRENGKTSKILHINKRKPAKFIRTAALLKLYEPVSTVNLGELSIEEDKILSFIERPVKFQLWRTVFWFFISRWFSEWKPDGGCAYIASHILREAGLNVKVCVKPKDLLKELEDGNYIIGRTSWSG